MQERSGVSATRPKGNVDAHFVIDRTRRNLRKISELASSRSTIR